VGFSPIKNLGGIFTFLVFFGVLSVLIYIDFLPLLAFPIGLLAIYVALFYPDYLLIAIFFMTPLSFNIEEFTTSFGLYVPTEPLLFGLMMLTIWRLFLVKKIPNYIFKNLIVIALASYLLVTFFTSIVSTHPLISFKALLSKLWYIIPIFGIGIKAFEKKKMMVLCIWLYNIGMTFAIIYTVIRHSMYGFGEQESHWVMSPLFKDHTIYGAMVAFSLPLVVGLYFYKKHDLLTSGILITLITINLIGLFFSYTRAAWLSVIVAAMVWMLIYFRVKFAYLVSIFLVGVVFVAFNWTHIYYTLAQNKKEHTTDNFEDRLRSAGNISSDASNLERINRWDCALQMFQKKPLTGFGPGTYAFEYAPFQRPENLTIISTNFGNGGNAHSEYLLNLSEMGIFGLLTFVFFVSMVFYRGIRLYFRLEDREYKILVLSMVLALSTYFLHAFLNNFLDTDKAAVPIYGICAFFIATEHLLSQINEQAKN